MLIEIIPYLIGAVVSPVLLIMAVILLAQPAKPIKQTLVYFLGAFLAVSAIGGLVFFALNLHLNSGKPTLSTSVIHILVGLLLVFLAIRALRKGNKPKKVGHTPHYARAFMLGVGLTALDFSSLLMFVPAAIETHSSSLEVRITALCLLIIATLLPIWLPLLLIVVLGRKGQLILSRMSVFMSHHGQQLTAGVIGAIALYVLYKGVIGL